MFREEQLIRELKLGGVNHNRMREWVNCVPARRYMPLGETFPPHRRQIPAKACF
jgi:hypothetical protein